MADRPAYQQPYTGLHDEPYEERKKTFLGGLLGSVTPDVDTARNIVGLLSNWSLRQKPADVPVGTALKAAADATPLGPAIDLVSQGGDLGGALGSGDSGRAGEAVGDIAKTVAAALLPGRKPIRGYHASPHVFDKFDLSKPGTGEGTQAFGHGAYIAENPKVTEEYLRQFREQGRDAHLYDVNIHADPKRIINDDLPFQRSGVPMAVIEKWREAKTAHERMEILRDAGFQGKKYLDAGSRSVGGTGIGTSNYVIYDPAILEILRRGSGLLSR